MANKFTQLEDQEPGTALVKVAQMGMDGGFRGDVSPRSIQAGETPVIDDVRFERTAIRKDFGWVPIGAPAAFPVRGLIEHKFISEGLEFARLVRVYQDAGGFAIIEVWDGADWIVTDTSDPITINDIYLSIISAQGALYFAEGSQILCWLEDFATINNENDFPAGANDLREQGDEVDVIVTPASPDLLQYTVGFSVSFNQIVSQGVDDEVFVEFLHEGDSLGVIRFVADRQDAFPLEFPDQTFVFNRVVDDLDVVTVKILAITSGTKALQDDVSPLSPPTVTVPQNIVLKSLFVPAINDEYRFSTFLPGIEDDGCFATLEYFVDFGDGIFVTQGTIQYQGPLIGGANTFVIPGLDGPNVRFGVSLVSQIGACSLFANFTRVRWDAYDTEINVHANNKGVSGDPTAGITYQTSGVAQSTFEPIDPGPGARYLVHFARRLVALQDLGDRQVFSFSRDGILTDFDGAGSGSLPLLDSRSDAIDALQGGAVLNSNFLAVFRQRSIMRAFESGNVQQAIGVVSWIENLGTNAPFSIRNVLGGVMFLGHDNMVYFLNEQGPQAVGLPIHQEIIEDLTGDLSLVDSAWDPTFAEYYLGIPVGAATEIDKVWVFDVDRFLTTQQKIWRRKPMDVQRFAAAGISEVV